MSVREKRAIKMAVLFIVVGIVTAFAAAEATGFDFSKLVNIGYENKTYFGNTGDDFGIIDIESIHCDVILRYSDDNRWKVVCPQNDKVKYVAELKNGTLTVRRIDERHWYDHIGVNLSFNAKLYVYLTDTEYSSIKVTTTSGNITVPHDFSFENASLETTSGDISFASTSDSAKVAFKTTSGDIDFSGKALNFTVTSTSGDIKADGLEACDTNIETVSGDISVSNAKSGISAGTTSGNIDLKLVVSDDEIRASAVSGNVRLTGCDAHTLRLNTTSGNITGTILSPKNFSASSISGTIKIPPSEGVDTCDMRTTSGNISIDISE